MNITRTTKAYISARQAAEAAEKAKAQAEAALKEAFAKAGVTDYTVDGVKVSVVKGERTSVDAEALAGSVSARIFKMLTKATVDTKKFKAALEAGQVSPEVAEYVTSVTAYEQVRVAQV